MIETIWPTGILVFAFGAVVGSFLNVVIFRYHTGRSVIGGRSRCLHCDRPLGFWELVPILSFLWLHGRCRFCRSPISWQYPTVEILAGFLFLGVVWRFGLDWSSVIRFFVASLLLVIGVYDLRHKIIPEGPVWLFAAAGLLLQLWSGLGAGAIWPFLAGGLGGGLVLTACFAALWLVSGGRWMGFGDVKLALGIGLLLGFRPGLAAAILAFWLGAAVGLGLIFAGRLLTRRSSFTIKSEIPFAPFLVVGTILVWLFNLDVFFL